MLLLASITSIDARMQATTDEACAPSANGFRECLGAIEQPQAGLLDAPVLVRSTADLRTRRNPDPGGSNLGARDDLNPHAGVQSAL